MRKTIYTIGLIFLVLFFAGCATLEQVLAPKPTVTSTGGPTISQAQLEPYSGPKARIAVARFTDKTRKAWWTREIGNGMADMLATALFNTNRYIVLEREALKDVLREQELATGGYIREETAVQTGQIEAAELLIMGAVTEFERDVSGIGGGLGSKKGAGILGGIKWSHLAMDLRVIDTRTSRLVVATSVEGSAADIGGLVGGLIGGDLGAALGGWRKTPMEKALRICIGEAVNFIVSQTPAQYYHYMGSGQSIAPSPGQSNVVYVTGPTANIRSGPGTEYRIVDSVSKGTQLIILEEKESWYNVRLPDGREGWVYKELTSR